MEMNTMGVGIGHLNLNTTSFEEYSKEGNACFSLSYENVCK